MTTIAIATVDPSAATAVTDLIQSADQLIACLPKDDEYRRIGDSQRRRWRRVIAGLVVRGVRPTAVPGWLLVILALLELLPEIIAVIEKIIDAIERGRQPADVLRELGD